MFPDPLSLVSRIFKESQGSRGPMVFVPRVVAKGKKF